MYSWFEALLSIGAVPFDLEKLITGVLKHLNAHLQVFKANPEATEDDRKNNDSYFRKHALPLLSALLSAVLRRSNDGIAVWIGYGKFRLTSVNVNTLVHPPKLMHRGSQRESVV